MIFFFLLSDDWKRQSELGTADCPQSPGQERDKSAQGDDKGAG